MKKIDFIAEALLKDLSLEGIKNYIKEQNRLIFEPHVHPDTKKKAKMYLKAGQKALEMKVNND
jgi:hypothetical protein